MAATRRSTSKKGGSSGDSAAGTTRQAATRPSSRPRTASDPQSPTDAPKRGRTAPRVKGRSPEQIEAARLAKNERERERRARIRAAEQAASSADEKPKAKPKGKPKGNATGKGSRRQKRPVRFRPAAPEDFAEVERALERSAEVQAREERLTPQQRVERDESVVAGLAMGLTVRTVAKQVGLAPAQVEQIQDAARSRYVDTAPRGEAVLWDALRGLDANIEAAAVMAAPAAGSATLTPLRLGALKLKHELQTARLELLLAMGLISASPATYERERQARDYLLRFLDELRDAGVDPQLIEQVATRAMPVDVAGDTVAAARHAANEDRSIAAG